MLLLVIMTVLVSLSDLFGPNAKVEVISAVQEERTPTYVAVLYGLLFPSAATFFTLIVKYINKTLKLEADDWMQGYNLIFSVVVLIPAIISWCTHEGTFSWTFLY